MKRTTYLTFALLGAAALLTCRCTGPEMAADPTTAAQTAPDASSTGEPQASAPEASAGNGSAATADPGYTSWWYYSYEALGTLSAADLGLAEGNFKPYTIAHRGDTLLIANTGGATHAFLLYDLKSRRVLRTVDGWSFNGETHTFTSPVEAFALTDERLYVSERGARIHVYELPDLNYVTCIGNGNWWGEVFQPQALAVRDGLLFARDKDSRISIYREADATPANYEKVKRYKQSALHGTSNNGWAPLNMVTDPASGLLAVTDYDGQLIRTLDPALATDEMTSETLLDVEELEIRTAFKPKTIALTEERLYATADDNGLHVYDRASQQWIKKLSTVRGWSFRQPIRIHAQEAGRFWISDTGSNTVIELGAFRNEIREFTPLDGTRVQVTEVPTRGGAPRTLVVDLSTHEIVE